MARCIGSLGALAAAAAWTAGAVERVLPADAPVPRAERALGAGGGAAEHTPLQPVTSVTLPIATGEPHRRGDRPNLASSTADGPRSDAGAPLSAVAADLDALSLARRPGLRDALATRLVGHPEPVRPRRAATGSD